MAKKVTVAKGVKVSRGKEKEMRKKAGSSNAGKYKGVEPHDFAGAAGGASKYSFPIESLKHAKSAIRLAHNAPNPEGLLRRIYAKWPQLKKNK